MADLSDLETSQTVKIVGTNSSGLETSAVNSTSDNRLLVDETINTSAVQTTINVTTSAVAARVGGSNLTNRKMLYIQCQTANMTYGFDVSSQPFSLPNNTTIAFEIGPNITLYLRRTSGSGSVVVAEFS